MRHLVKKIRFKLGRDASRILQKKLIHNFLQNGKITTTKKRAEVLKPLVEKLVEKAKEKTEANKNYLKRYVLKRELIDFLFDQVGPSLSDKTGGYVKIVKLIERSTDGALITRLEWAYPVVKEVKK